MANGGSSGSSEISPWQSLRIPPIGDHYLFSSATSAFSSQISDIAHHFNLDSVPEKILTKNVVKVVEDLSHQICKYHSLVLGVGTKVDGEPLRKELAKLQQNTCDNVTTARTMLSDAFRRTESLPKREVVNLEKSCRVLVACIHTLDRELRRTLHLYHLFPLVPHPDVTKECHFIDTGLSESLVIKNDFLCLNSSYDLSEKYFREKDSLQELEKGILKVHNLDVDLHRDEILGPLLDYLTLCPSGLDDISSSTISESEMCSAFEGCNEESLTRKKSSLVCYIIAIMAVVFVGGGVLMGVIFMIVY